MVAAILWTGFGLGVLLGLVAIRVSDDRAAWPASVLSTEILLAFSFAGGFSIGPLVIALPVLFTALVVGRGMAAAPRLLIVVGAGAAYWVITWGFGPIRPVGPGWLVADTLLILAAYLTALVGMAIRRPRAESSN